MLKMQFLLLLILNGKYKKIEKELLPRLKLGDIPQLDRYRISNISHNTLVRTCI